MNNRRSVGVVEAITRYPVKSMQGESLQIAAIDIGGIGGDRSWGVMNADTGHVLTAKRVGSLLDAQATLGPGGPLIQLPDGTRLAEPGPVTDQALSDWLGTAVVLRSAGGTGTAFEMSFNVDDEDADKFEWSTPAGSFLDLAPVHVLTTAALAAAATAYPDGDWSAHRFRPTLLIDTGGDIGFVENNWVGAALAVGDATLDVTMPTIRCALPTKAQAVHSLDRDLQVFKSLVEHNNQNIGAYTTVRTPGSVRVGDTVTLVD